MPSNDGPTTACTACGHRDAHDPGCPAGNVRVVDKREERRQAAELARLAREADELATKTGPQLEPVELEHDNEPEVRVRRIRELLDRSDLTDEESGELLTLQAEQAEHEQAEQTPEGVDAVTAFVVVQLPDGTWMVSPDLNVLYSVDRLATLDDMYAGASIVQRDITVSLTAKNVTFGLQMAGKAMADQRNATVLAKALKGNRS